MKMLTAAVVVSQVLLAAGCKPAPCDKGCELETTYELKLRTADGQCTRRGETLDLFVPITSCDVADTEPKVFGSCIEGKNNEVLCTRPGLCLRYQVVRESRFSCKCPPKAPVALRSVALPTPECEGDEHCPVGEFCRAKAEAGGCSATAKECVPSVQEGGSCGGRRLACAEERCASGLECKGAGLAVDRPGTCERAPTCRALPTCRAVRGAADFTCKREDFVQRKCVKVTKCGVEISCRVKL